MGGGDTRVFLMEMKWAVSLSSLVNVLDGLSFPSTCSTRTVLSFYCGTIVHRPCCHCIWELCLIGGVCLV